MAFICAKKAGSVLSLAAAAAYHHYECIAGRGGGARQRSWRGLTLGDRGAVARQEGGWNQRVAAAGVRLYAPAAERRSVRGASGGWKCIEKRKAA